MSDELKGVCVLVTRPSHQAGNLVKLIESHGGEALRFPTLEIEGNADRESILAKIGNVADYDIAIFISVNAVNHGVPYLPTTGKRPLLAAIGPSTARALVEAGLRSDIKATRGFTSEALLHEPALKDVAGKKIIIFRGSGGRALLGRELEERGANVTYAEVYRRDRPDVLDPAVESRLAAGTVDVVTATSAETLFNLYELAEEQSVTGLTRTQLVTSSERVVKKAAALGFDQTALLARGPDDHALVEAILKWRKDTGSGTEATTGTTMTDPSEQDRYASIIDKAAAQKNASQDSVSADSVAAQRRDSHPDSTPDSVPKNQAEQADSGPDAKPEPDLKPHVKTENEDSIIKTPANESLSTPAPVAGKRGGGFLSLLAILLSMAALAASAYVWWGQKQTGSAIVESQQATEDAIATTQQDIAALGGRLDDNLSRVSRLDASRGSVESNVADMRSSVETLTARVQGTEQSIDAVRGVSASARNNWIRAEAEYFLQAANSRLQLARDPDAALAALEAADDRIKSLGDPSLYPVRQQLAGEIAALKAVPRPDMEGMSHTLNGLAARVEQLPLLNASPESYEPAADTSKDETAGAMERAASTIGRVITSMVSVKRTDEQAKPLMSRDEEFFLKRNLELQLQTARLALLRGEAANFTESLRTARNWLQTHFQTDAASVQSAIRELADLEQEEIAPSLPDISGSLRQLRLARPAENAASRRPPAQRETTTEKTVDEAASLIDSDPIDGTDNSANDAALSDPSGEPGDQAAAAATDNAEGDGSNAVADSGISDADGEALDEPADDAISDPAQGAGDEAAADTNDEIVNELIEDAGEQGPGNSANKDGETA